MELKLSVQIYNFLELNCREYIKFKIGNVIYEQENVYFLQNIL